MTPSSQGAGAPDDVRFAAFHRLLPEGAAERLANARVAVIGVGGVGSWAVEALARCGIGSLVLVDPDTVCRSNINRQLPALESTVGEEKISVLAGRVRDISPGIHVEMQSVYFTASTAAQLLDDRLDCVIDAVDRMSVKALILDHCHRMGIPAVTVGGSGGRLDPTRIEVKDLGLSGSDELLRQVRKRLRRAHGWAAGEGNHYGIPAVFSREPMRMPQACATNGDMQAHAQQSLRLSCEGGLGSAVFVTACFGMVAAAEAIRLILRMHDSFS